MQGQGWVGWVADGVWKTPQLQAKESASAAAHSELSGLGGHSSGPAATWGRLGLARVWDLAKALTAVVGP